MLPPLQVQLEMPPAQEFDAKYLSNHLPPDVSDKGRSLATEIQSLSLSGEEFRQKIEAFKDEVGSKWLSMVPEINGHHMTASISSPHHTRSGAVRPEAPPFRASSQGIVSGQRTLG